MCVNIFGFIVCFKISPFRIKLFFQALNISQANVSFGIKRGLKEPHISSCPFHIFFNFIPNFLIFEKCVPYTRFWCRKWMIYNLFLGFCLLFLCLNLWLWYKFIFKTFIIFQIFIQCFLPFAGFGWQATQYKSPYNSSQAYNFIGYTRKGLFLKL